MSLDLRRRTAVLLWTTAAVGWSWVLVGTAAGRGTAVVHGEPEATAAATDLAHLPSGDPRGILVLRLARPVEPEVIVRRELVPARQAGPAPARAVAPAPAPPPQRSSGS